MITRGKVARYLELLSWICEDAAERVDRNVAIDEARKQDEIGRVPLIDKEGTND